MEAWGELQLKDGSVSQVPRIPRFREALQPWILDFPAQRAFTLVELLTVIAIVSLLASLVLTALSGTTAKVYRTSCLNNLRQLSLGIQIYADEFDGEYPPRWLDPSWVEQLKPYYSDPQILKCPTQKLQTGRTYVVNGFNDWFEAVLSPVDYDDYKFYLWPHGMNSLCIPEPVETITFGELLPGSGQVHMDFFQGAGNDLEEIDHGRHSLTGRRNGGSNFAFTDGSARFLRYWGSLTPRNLWAVTARYRNLAVAE